MPRPIAGLLFALLAALPAAAQPDAPAKGAKAPGPFDGRKEKAREQLVKDRGGSEASEKAVADGLAWLAKAQQTDGSWVFDGTAKKEATAATGMAVLAFVGAGETHTGKGKYAKTVRGGVTWLAKNQIVGGGNAGRLAKADNMYGHAIGTLALVEAFAVSKDRTLLGPAQSAVNFIQRAQGPNGSWGYQPGTKGDTSITGWQLQVLYAATLSKDVKVDPRVVKQAVAFLDAVAAGEKKEKYGYSDNAAAAAGTALTAIGLWSRHCFDGWKPTTPGMAAGVEGLMTRAPGGTTAQPRANTPVLEPYLYYYATQVLFRHGGDEWKDWNEGPKAADGTRKNGLRDWLVNTQVQKEGREFGSWDPSAVGYIGSQCGRVGTTAMWVLTLEVYYRYPPDAPEPKADPKKKP